MEDRQQCATTQAFWDTDTYLVCLYEYLTQMANKRASQLDILTANFLAGGKGKRTFRTEISTHHSQKMLSYQYSLAQKKDIILQF